MTNPNDTSTKIKRLAEFAIEEYHIEQEIMNSACARTLQVNNLADSSGFSETNVFISEGGVFFLVAYKKNHHIEITVLHNNLYDIYIESERKKQEYTQNQPLQEVMDKLYIWGGLWDTSEYCQGTHTIPNWRDSAPERSFTDTQVVSRSLMDAVSAQRMILPVGT
jgi:hypothetical protein